MKVKPEPERPAEAERGGHDARGAQVGDNVIRSLGRPPGLLRLQVRSLWGDFFRVNVFVGGDVASATIANSFFVQADPGGHILQAVPAITKQYGLGPLEPSGDRDAAPSASPGGP